MGSGVGPDVGGGVPAALPAQGGPGDAAVGSSADRGPDPLGRHRCAEHGLVVRRPGFESADDVVEQGAAADREGAEERGVSGQPPPLLRAGQGTGQGGSGELGERVLGGGEGGEEPDDAGRCRQ